MVFGDVDDQAGSRLEKTLVANKHDDEGSVSFAKTDVGSYESQLQLFDTAMKKHGCIDHAVSVAAVQEAGNWFDPSLTLETIRTVRALAISTLLVR